MNRLEIILRDRNQLDIFNKVYLEDVQDCYSRGLGMPIGKSYLPLPEYIQKVYMSAFYPDFVMRFMAGTKRPRQ